MKNIRTYNKMVREMKAGEAIYINAIGCSIAIIEQLRKDVEEGKLVPEQSELDAMIKKEAQNRYITGESICPQMTYIRL